MDPDLNIAVLAAVTCAVGYLMTVSGVHKSVLEWRRRERICPSCGRHIAGRSCRCTG
jgi:hypothetical protein